MKTVRLKFIFYFLSAVLLCLPPACRNHAEKDVQPLNVPEGMIFIRGGVFEMGDPEGMPFEKPVHAVELDSFLIDENEVTVAEFAKFVAATGYRTEAERFGWSAVFDFAAGEWRRANGADWRHPEGADSTAKENDPVTQVSWNDAAAFAKWAGGAGGQKIRVGR